MSAFICARCSNFRDADDGCEEAPDGYRLVCADCVLEQAAADAGLRDRVIAGATPTPDSIWRRG